MLSVSFHSPHLSFPTLLVSFSIKCIDQEFLTRLSSLTLGLMGLDELHLRVLATSSDDEKERRNAQKGKKSVIGPYLTPS